MAPTPDLAQRVQDRALAKGLVAGKLRAWDEFYAAYGDPLYRFVLARGGSNPDRAADVTQDAVVAALECIAQFDSKKGTLWNWLCGIAVNKLREATRKDARETRFSEALVCAPPEAAPTTEHVATGVMTALSLLHPRHQDVLSLKYMQALPVRVIAQRLATTEKAVESRLTRAREAFRRTYESLQAPGGRNDG